MDSTIVFNIILMIFCRKMLFFAMIPAFFICLSIDIYVKLWYYIVYHIKKGGHANGLKCRKQLLGDTSPRKHTLCAEIQKWGGKCCNYSPQEHSKHYFNQITRSANRKICLWQQRSGCFHSNKR